MLIDEYQRHKGLKKKARMGSGRHLVDAHDRDIYSSKAKGISVMLLYVIVHKTGMRQLYGDGGNTYIIAFTKESLCSCRSRDWDQGRKHGDHRLCMV